MSTEHDRLFRMEGRMTELVTVGLFGEGLRMYNSFEGRIVAGEPAGATVRGVDVFTIRPTGSGSSTAASCDGRRPAPHRRPHRLLAPAGRSGDAAARGAPRPRLLLAGRRVHARGRRHLPHPAPQFAELGRIPVVHFGRVNMATRELVIEGFRLPAPDRAGRLATVR